MRSNLFKARDRVLDVSTPQIMGILNVTPDSFSDGGSYTSLGAAVEQAQRMYDEGAAIIDIGGESTRPGAAPVTLEMELERVVPVVEAVSKHCPEALISVDTSSPEVMTESVKVGAHIWNDIRALTRHHAVETAAALGVGICLMHMQGTPQNMQDNPHYDDQQGGVVGTVKSFLHARAQECLQAGIDAQSIMLDPGFGFGKTVEENYILLNHIAELTQDTDFLLMAALSRKSMIGKITGQEIPAERVCGSVVAGFYALEKGAHFLRVHDVAATVEATKIFQALRLYR